MKIIKIQYQQTLQAVQFHPINILAEAEINEGEDPTAAMAELKRFVVEELDKAKKDFLDKLNKPTQSVVTNLPPMAGRMTDVEKKLNGQQGSKSLPDLPKDTPNF